MPKLAHSCVNVTVHDSLLAQIHTRLVRSRLVDISTLLSFWLEKNSVYDFTPAALACGAPPSTCGVERHTASVMPLANMAGNPVMPEFLSILLNKARDFYLGSDFASAAAVAKFVAGMGRNSSSGTSQNAAEQVRYNSHRAPTTER